MDNAWKRRGESVGKSGEKGCGKYLDSRLVKKKNWRSKTNPLAAGAKKLCDFSILQPNRKID
jgi:hypothetical protein